MTSVTKPHTNKLNPGHAEKNVLFHYIISTLLFKKTYLLRAEAFFLFLPCRILPIKQYVAATDLPIYSFGNFVGAVKTQIHFFKSSAH